VSAQSASVNVPQLWVIRRARSLCDCCFSWVPGRKPVSSSGGRPGMFFDSSLVVGLGESDWPSDLFGLSASMCGTWSKQKSSSPCRVLHRIGDAVFVHLIHGIVYNVFRGRAYPPHTE
jgi:hypothetical protein